MCPITKDFLLKEIRNARSEFIINNRYNSFLEFGKTFQNDRDIFNKVNELINTGVSRKELKVFIYRLLLDAAEFDSNN